LGGSGVLANGSLESSELFGGKCLHLLVNEPTDAFRAWWGRLGPNIGENSLFTRGWQQFSVVDGCIGDNLAALIGNASCRAAVDDSVGIVDSEVADFSICSINDSISAVRKDTVESAVIWNVGVGSSQVTLFPGIFDAISATSLGARSTAGVFDGVRVQITVVTLLISVGNAVSAFFQHSTRTTVSVAAISIVTLLPVVSINNTIGGLGCQAVDSAESGGSDGIALLTVLGINNTVSAKGKASVGSAGVRGGVRVEGAVVASFTEVHNSITPKEFTDSGTAGSDNTICSSSVVALFSAICDTITADGVGAVSSASVGSGVAVVRSVIALLSSVDNTIAAQETAVGASLRHFVAFFSHQIINDAITTNREGASGSAKVGDVGGQGQNASIALFGGINNTITAVSLEAVQSAGVGEGIGVHDSIVALLANVEDAIPACLFSGTSGRASISIDAISIVTLFSVVLVDHTVSAVWECAGRSARIRDSVAVQSSIVANFSCVDDAVSAAEPSAVGSAGVGVSV